MIITIITGNPGKQREFKEWLSLTDNIEIQFKNFEIPEIRDPLVENVAKAKALEVFAYFHEPFLVEDTGLFFEGYNHFPGTYPKYIFQSLGYKGILKLTEENDRAYFQSVIAYMDNTLAEPLIFSGVTKGKIQKDIDNAALEGFPYDNIFIPDGFDKVNARLTFEELSLNNHRAKSIKLFCEFFNTYAKIFT